MYSWYQLAKTKAGSAVITYLLWKQAEPPNLLNKALDCIITQWVLRLMLRSTGNAVDYNTCLLQVFNVAALGVKVIPSSPAGGSWLLHPSINAAEWEAAGRRSSRLDARVLAFYISWNDTRKEQFYCVTHTCTSVPHGIAPQRTTDLCDSPGCQSHAEKLFVPPFPSADGQLSSAVFS